MTPMTRRVPLLVAFLLALTTLGDAAPVARPVKTCGATTYVDETAAGCTSIKNTEVDADLAAIIAGVNAVDSAQIVNGTIAAVDLATNAVTSAKILDATIVGADLAPGAAVNGSVQANVNTAIGFGTTETTVVTLPSITTRGGRISISGSWSLIAVLTSSITSVITLRVKEDGATFYTLAYTVGTVINTRTIVPVPLITRVPSSAAHVYTITAQSDDPSCQLATQGANAGIVYVIEHS
jgi:hypothetical protein